MIELHVGDCPLRDELVALYSAVGWTTYTREPERLRAAVEASSMIITARSGATLVGLARGLSDGHHILYIQDILVDPSAHRRGIGRALLEALEAQYPGVRARALLTDDRPEQEAFYRAVGFCAPEEMGLRTFVRFKTT